MDFGDAAVEPSALVDQEKDDGVIAFPKSPGHRDERDACRRVERLAMGRTEGPYPLVNGRGGTPEILRDPFGAEDGRRRQEVSRVQLVGRPAFFSEECEAFADAAKGA